MRGRVLIVAGSDSGGGAGIQADIKACAAMDAYSATAVTALTAQDTLGVHGVHPVPPDFIRQQIRLTLRDIGADAVKTGMLGDAVTIEAVCDALAEEGRGIPVVVDPVMVAKGGSRLLAPEAVEMLKRRLLPFAALLTPNIPEAEVLSGMRITGLREMRAAAEMMLTLGVPAVLLKGGHMEGDLLLDLLATEDGIQVFESRRIDSRHTHGTGCTLASAIAAGLAQGMVLRDAVSRGRNFVQAALKLAPGLGKGHGPLNHGVTIDPARIASLS
ncbi:bifunctional hydroxymethylpyrimidine kinase/phosphomethylpyrimidine kinase [Roseomonas marmotae]|uniref:hydroxymethylpyrimidine kinase n=1 Tax=Roseomonas marmotae TaxID=2768161 RepID=A0ABS3KD62_9PROT|nr:bifunctional hydroxymethylpyrimidine kinase/phosphomethylpyrimidine kinase [Roseomonas marmotae]MBO1075413.1 bifunctional hydroxymethylpyrimidine kinase/phosphomethylpyrimidine kinase [Roseomonas marmotae]QTI78399.1 bifunctional hydroxymethylpyrimidine kinase/phosphomethylpyrimidine kinase [Roseomonas marmotae]